MVYGAMWYSSTSHERAGKPNKNLPTVKFSLKLLKYDIKGIVWEIYACISAVLSYLGRMFGMIFRVQWGQKSPKSGKMCLTKMQRVLARVPQGPCKSAEGAGKGAAGRSSISGAAPLQGLGGTLARTRIHFGQTHYSTFWWFLTPLNPKNHTKHPP